MLGCVANCCVLPVIFCIVYKGGTIILVVNHWFIYYYCCLPNLLVTTTGTAVGVWVWVCVCHVAMLLCQGACTYYIQDLSMLTKQQ